jgi:hypothetical protein
MNEQLKNYLEKNYPYCTVLEALWQAAQDNLLQKKLRIAQLKFVFQTELIPSWAVIHFLCDNEDELESIEEINVVPDTQFDV